SPFHQSETLEKPSSKDIVQGAWKTFGYFNPDLNFIYDRCCKSKQRKDFPYSAIRNQLFPFIHHDDLEARFIDSMKRGTRALNDLCHRFQDAHPLLSVKEYHPDNLQNWLYESYVLLSQKDGMLEAYERSRAFGLGVLVTKIDTAPEVLHSLTYFDTLLSELHNLLDVSQQTETEWVTSQGVRICGQKPITGRLKHFIDNKVILSSILLKMLRKHVYPDQLQDYIGCRIILATSKDREKLVRYFRDTTSFTGLLEDFTTSSTSANPHSLADFSQQKFILRLPVHVPIPETFPGEYIARFPVEIQLFTLAEYTNQQKSGSHHRYKQAQFESNIPI
ncbi:MAG: hypothetical protein Q7K45_02340, partial [Nanoarchaeota archaeon]|nr:hypothetical protein [Nanoarchaeota archaeon]